jgi:F-type H+-transporting ATPase subunit delta
MRTTRRHARIARQLYRLCLVDGLLDESRARLVVHHVVAARQRGALAILSYFHRLVRLDRDRHTAHVESAVGLPEDLRAAIEAAVAQLFGRGVKADFTQNAGLIGGMRLRVGSRVYDGSVRGRLASIEARL